MKTFVRTVCSYRVRRALRSSWGLATLSGLGTLATGCSATPATDGRDDSTRASATDRPSAAQATVATSDASDTARIQAYLDSLYTQSDIRHKFTTKFSEVIDCIDFKAQPSVKAAAKQGVILADQGPPVAPPALPAPPKIDASVALTGQPDQTGSARSCPSGSVPYPRVTVAQIQQAGGLDAYLWALSHQMPSRFLPPANPICSRSPPMNGYAWAVANQAVSNLGVTKIAAVYNPGLTVSTNCGPGKSRQCEHSLSQLWETTGACQYPSNCTYGASGNAVQSVEFGWHVDPNVEPDANTHLFSYSTQNGYNPNFNGFGCYNLGCSQFTQVSSPMYFPGQTVSGIVYPGQGQPVEYAFEAFNPGASYPAQYHNWYIYVNGSLIGYYAGSLFAGTMQTAATTWEVGGEVFSDYLNSPNDDVQMGSGYSPNGNGFPWAAYDRNIYYINSGSGSATYCGNPFCSNGFCFVDPRPSWGLGVCGYQATTFYAQSTTDAPGGSQSSCWGPYFYYGGGI